MNPLDQLTCEADNDLLVIEQSPKPGSESQQESKAEETESHEAKKSRPKVKPIKISNLGNLPFGVSIDTPEAVLEFDQLAPGHAAEVTIPVGSEESVGHSEDKQRDENAGPDNERETEGGEDVEISDARDARDLPRHGDRSWRHLNGE